MFITTTTKQKKNQAVWSLDSTKIRNTKRNSVPETPVCQQQQRQPDRTKAMWSLPFPSLSNVKVSLKGELFHFEDEKTDAHIK